MTSIPFTEDLLVAIKNAVATNNPELIPYPYELEPNPTSVPIVLSLEAAQALKSLTQNPLETTWVHLTGPERREIFNACVTAGV